jgi:hypothetical protein
MMLEIKLARNDSKLRMTGMTLAMDGNIWDAISTP